MVIQRIAAVALLTFGVSGIWASQTGKPAPKALEAFQHSVAELQQRPEDQELRKKVIQLGQRLKPAPQIPKEARGHFSRAYSLQREAKSAQDYESAVEEYQKALTLAPWWAAVYYHLGTAYERLDQYDPAIANLRFYLASDPGHAGAREALDRIQHMEEGKKKVEKKPPTAN